MIAQLSNENYFEGCFNDIDKAVEYLSRTYTSHNADVLAKKWNEYDSEYIVAIRFHNNTDEFIMTYRFIELIPLN